MQRSGAIIWWSMRIFRGLSDGAQSSYGSKKWICWTPFEWGIIFLLATKKLLITAFSYNYNFPTGESSYFYYNPSQDGRQDLSYLNYFGVDISESSLAPRNPRHLIPSFGQDFNHGRRSNEDLANYSNNSPGMEVGDMMCNPWYLILMVYPDPL